MNIIIPLGGLGSRFLETGFSLPKPLINLLFKPILFWLLDSLSLSDSDRVIVVCNKRLIKYRFKELINKSYKNIDVIYLESDTRGAAETVLFGLQIADLNKPTLLLDGDTFYIADILKIYRESVNKNVVFSFKQQDDRPIYSYVKVVENKIVQIAEKQQISDLANTGAYAFATGEILKQYCELAVKKFNKAKQKELYTSSIILDMIHDNVNFECIILQDTDFEVVGTPLQYKLFHNKYKKNKKYFNDYRICFDFDNTLVTHPDVPGDYTTVRPIDQNINYANFLHDLGCTIIIYTARRMKTHGGNVGSIVADVGRVTIDTIERYNIPCDELYFGKPYAHAYIDDLAYNAFDDYPFLLGATDHHVKERDFNTTQSKTLQVFEKSSSNVDKLKAEVFWYNQIPKPLKQYTPAVIRGEVDNNNSYLLEKIDGITMSELLVSQSLNESIFKKLLEIISEFHEHKPAEVDFNMYGLYSAKLQTRYNDYDYSRFEYSEDVYNDLLVKSKDYESANNGIIGCIHGDPVFSNVMIDRVSCIKLIDPRGITSDNKLCIYGDIMYDYGKILQSLSGYDEIMLTGEKFLDNRKMIDLLYQHVSLKYGEQYIDHINMIKSTLLYTLIPLHDNNRCEKYYKLINNV